jgi:hypothetical protein
MSEMPQDKAMPNDGKSSKLKNIALFFASPFIGLVYAVLLPGKVFQIAMREFKANAKSK